MSNPLPFEAFFSGDPEQLIVGVIKLGIWLAGKGHKNPYQTFGEWKIVIGEYPDSLSVYIQEILRSGTSRLQVTGINQEAWEKNARWWEVLRRGLGLVGGPQLEERLVSAESKLMLDDRCPLTEDQKEILRLIGKGLNNYKIGEKTHNSENTIKGKVTKIFNVLGLEKSNRKREIAVKVAKDKGYI